MELESIGALMRFGALVSLLKVTDGWRFAIGFVVLRTISCSTLALWLSLCSWWVMTLLSDHHQFVASDILGHGMCSSCGQEGGIGG